MKTTWMLFTWLLVIVSSSASATEIYEYYNGVRQMGMGGVAVATVNDETSLLLNPAALGKLRNAYLTLIDPEVAGSTNNQGIVKTGGPTLGFLDPQKLLNQLNNKPGRHFNFSGSVLPSLVVPNFGMGLHAKYRINAEVREEDSNYYYNYLNDYALVMGFSLRIWDGRIKFGANGRLTNRVEADAVLPAASTDVKLKDLVREGIGIGTDVGLILTAPWVWLPSLAVVWRDAGTTSYNLNDGILFDEATRPNAVHQTYDVGLSISPILGNRTRMQLGFEYKDAADSKKTGDSMSRAHAGVEFNFADMIFLRGGWNQRYWTAGFEFQMHMLQFQIASYGEEIGDKDDPREDRRYMGKFSFRF